MPLLLTSNHRPACDLDKENIILRTKLEESTLELKQLKSSIADLKEEKCDLELVVAENDVYSQALQEHIDELECVCTTLMKQRDEQHHYFSQRELTLNCNNSQKVDKIYKEKVAAVTQCTSLKIDFELLSDELSHMKARQSTWLQEKSELLSTIDDQQRELKLLQNELAAEKQTVVDLTASHTSRLQDLAECRTKPLIDAKAEQVSSTEVTEKLEKLVKKYQVLRNATVTEETNRRLAELEEKLNTSDSRLKQEKRENRELRDEVRRLTIELDKTKQHLHQGALLSLNSSRCLKDMSAVVACKKKNAASLPLFAVDQSFSETTLSPGLFQRHLSSSPPAPGLAFTSSTSSKKIAAANENALRKLRSLSII